MINKFEAMGIFASIAVMALVLAVVRFDFNLNTLARTHSDSEQSNQGAVVVTSEGETDSQSLENALYESADPNGDLTDLIINDITLGEGEEVEEGDTVSVHYIGSTQAGVQFDSSYTRGEPFIFTVGGGRVIEGWEKGLVGMKVGGERILVIPPHMAYGNRQVGPIAPNSVLVFAIELLKIEK